MTALVHTQKGAEDVGHSRLFDRVRSLVRLSRTADHLGCSVDDARGEAMAERELRLSRRQMLGGIGVAAAAVVGVTPFTARAAPVRGAPRIAIVGAGLAGLACADELRRRGLSCRIYEALPGRVGGRVLTDHDTFPGQVAECGGEMIDTFHTTMLSYAREFGLAREDLEHTPGSFRYHFFGSLHAEDEVVAQWRALEPRVAADFRTLSNGPSFFSHTAADAALDDVDLATYLSARASDLPLIREVLYEAYIAEYGLEPYEQSSLNFLQFIHMDRRRHFSEFGVFSDERYHLIGGNDGIARAIAARVTDAGSAIDHGASLTRLARNASGEYQLFFNGSTAPEIADAVVVTVPFSVLRGVTLDASLGLSTDKLRAINELGYGNNAKTMVRFNRRVWAEQGGTGEAYADLANVQNTWETNYMAPGRGAGGILTDYSGGNRGYGLQQNAAHNFGCGGCHAGPPTDSVLSAAGAARIDGAMEDFVRDLDRVFPGAAAAASRDASGRLIGRRGHWTPQRYSRGSYTAYHPGQFTTIAGLEGQAAGALKFAGEHTDSFYDSQGFMEGACNSGIRAAQEILADIRARRL